MPDSRTVPIPVIGECLELKCAGDTNTSICCVRVYANVLPDLE